ncbi:DAN domain family member 5 [Pelobates cultripes]|uniref:DAN domain family member 5 n=1 Tax=Pelobates cultripes TaxID=61616 RepID=A0AAD1RJV3_PELCU|nr:DAN domain family member 5 [Pelobates cultripes]
MLLSLFLQFFLAAGFMVIAAPHGNEDGSASVAHNMPPRAPNESLRNSPFYKKFISGASAVNKIPGASLEEPMSEEDLKRKMIWQRTIERNQDQPSTVIPIGVDAVKRERCEALPFQQIVSRKHCIPIRIPNKFCFGQCNSFYVPGHPSSSCSSCIPILSRRISVALQCRYGRISWEEVELVQTCDCMAQSDKAVQ